MLFPGMRAMEVVEALPAIEVEGSIVQVLIGVGPFAQGGLDEPLGFVVGSRGVWTRENVPGAALRQDAAKRPGVVAGAVVGHDSLDGHTQIEVDPRNRTVG